jgi:hypothetical protein
VTGTVIVSETVLSSKSVRVASVKWTSVTVAVHIGFGHEPGGAVGATVSTEKRNCGNLFASGGVQPFTWSVVAGALPSRPGAAEGGEHHLRNPTTAGTFTFTVRVTDDLGAFSEKEFSITII